MSINKLLERIQLHWDFYRRATTVYKIQSPFIYEIISDVIVSNKEFYSFKNIEIERKELLRNREFIPYVEFGAGKHKTKRQISEIARSSLAPKQQGQLLFKLVNKLKPTVMLELGTCLGITSSYLMAARSSATLYTFEGNEAVLSVADNLFKRLGFNNAKTILGNFNTTLGPVLAEVTNVDFAYIDGNHSYEATMRYVDIILPKMSKNGVIVLDDILWSKEMQEAWKKIISRNEVVSSLEIRDLGIIFLDEKLQKQHLTLIPYYLKPWQFGLFM